MNVLEKASLAVRALEDKKALDVNALKVDQLTSLTEIFVIASAASSSQLRAMADEVEERLTKAGQPPRKLEGTAASGWILLDLDGVMVQLFHQEKRKFYQMERLWADAEILHLSQEEKQ